MSWRIHQATRSVFSSPDLVDPHGWPTQSTAAVRKVDSRGYNAAALAAYAADQRQLQAAPRFGAAAGLPAVRRDKVGVVSKRGRG